MKILFVIDVFNTHSNGTSISAQRFAEELRKRGHEVRILTVGETSDTIFGLKELYFPFFMNIIHKHGFMYAKCDELTIRKAVEWAEIVHFFFPFFLTNNTKKVVDELGKPSTAAFHVQPQNITSSFFMGKVDWANNWIFKIFRDRTYNKFGHVHVPSEFMGRELVKRGYTAKIHAISNGIQSDFTWMKRSKAPEFEGKILIMMVGRLTNEKRQDILINAVEHSKYGDRIQLIFAGTGPTDKTLHRLGKKLKNPPIFGYYNKQELMDKLSQCDLYVHASDMESEAISCIEAFATGLVPVISDSTLSATSQFALDERSLFKAGDPKDLARKIDYWLDNSEEKARMEKVYAESAKEYDIDHSITKFERMLREAVEDHKKAHISNSDPVQYSVPTGSLALDPTA
ncbi:MAG: glycosyltransferase [Bacteroidales bacterium]|nr:glycosyltransferase [Bacteroidales bacterium]